MAEKITFKKEPKETGLARVARPHSATTIKQDGKMIGSLAPPSMYNNFIGWRVCIRAKQEAHPGWRNVCFNAAQPSEPDARAWFLKNFAAICKKYEISPEKD